MWFLWVVCLLGYENLQGNYFLRFFPTDAGDFTCLAGFFSLTWEILHACWESRRNSVQAGDSLSMRESWKPCVNAFCFSAYMPNLSRSQPLLSMEYGNWFLDEQDTRQSTELKSAIRSVLSCLSYLFMYILISKFIKNRIKKKAKKKKKKWKLEFCWIKYAPKNKMRAAALRHRIYSYSLI